MKTIIEVIYRKIIFKYLKYISRILTHLGFTSEVIGVPKGFYEITLQWVQYYARTNNTHIDNYYKEVYPEHQIYRRPAKRNKDEIRTYPDEKGFHYILNSSFVSFIPNGRVCGVNGAVISPDDRIIGDVSREFDLDLHNHTLFDNWKLPALKKLDSRVAVICAPGGTGYYHWMFDVLPRMDLLNKAGVKNEEIDYIVTNSLKYPFHEESLQIFDVNPDKVIESNNRLHIKASCLVVPSLPALSGHVPRTSCDLLRKKFLPNSPIRRKVDNSRIYVGRGGVSSRHIINQDDLLVFLSKYNFSYVELDNLTILEQAELFNKSEFIVAPHGSALTNLVFCEPGTKVIELLNPNYLNGCYWHLSSQMNLDYYYLSGLGEYFDSTFNPLCNLDNIEVGLESFEKLLRISIM